MQLFLSYNSADRTSVVAVQKLLQARDITTFLDRDNLVSGMPWPQALEQALKAVNGVAVFIGRELGGWQKREMWFALDRQVREEKEGRPFPVIPVLLHDADLTPGFLFLNTWIDLRDGLEAVFFAEAVDAFETAIKATKPVRDRNDSSARAVERAGICPYRGLQVFREEDAAFFVGRKAFAKQLLDFTLSKDLVAVVGPSGSGKSSVVQAGLLPLLRREQPPANTWDAISFTPGRDPFHRLASALIPLLEPDMSETARLAEAEKLGGNLAANRTRVEAVINRVIEKSNGTGQLLLIADQFEELFTLTPEPSRQPFAQALLHTRGNAPVTVLVTLRADFYSQIITLDRELSDVLAPVQVNIGALKPDELRESITAPAGLVGLEFESGLVDRILTDVGSEPGRLPLVEFALTEIWQRREGRRLTNHAYDEIGGVTGALARRAEAEFAQLSPEEQTGARRLFSRLVRVARPEEAGDTRQRAELSEANTLEKRLANRLADARLLVTGSEAGTTSVEVAHEVLIRNWERLRGWLNEDREFLLWRQRLNGLLAGWERAQGSHDALLRGPIFSEAQNWLDQRSQDLSEQERKFISASREERERLAREEKERQERELIEVEKRRQEQAAAAKSLARLAWVLAVVAIAAVGAAIFGFWQKNEAEIRKQAAEVAKAEAKRQETIAKGNADKEKTAHDAAQEQTRIANERLQAAQSALTDDFFRTIGVSQQQIPTRDEREALWELAQLDRANAVVRRDLLNRWLGAADAFMRGNARDEQGFRSATGLNVEYHRLVTSGAAELGRRLATALENPQETNSYRLSKLKDTLEALANKMEPQAAAELAKGLAAVLEDPQETNSDRLSSLASALEALANKMEPQAAAELAKGLAAVLENPQETEHNRLSSLASALEALADKMEPQAAAELAKGLAAVLENPQETDSHRLFHLATALEALANKMEPQAAAELAKGLAAVLENPQETEHDRLLCLASALAALANKMEPQAAAELAKGLAAVLENPQETDSNRLSSLGTALAALVNKMEPQAAAELAKGLATVSENPQETDSNRLSSLGTALAALVNKMEPQAAAKITRQGAQRLVAALENPQETDSDRLSKLANALAMLANKMESQAAAKITRQGAQRLVAALENPQENDSDRLSNLANALAMLANKMEPQAVAKLAKGFAAALENPKETDFSRVSSLGSALEALASKIQPQAAAELAKGLAAVLENPKESDLNRFDNLGSALAALANKMEPQPAAELAKGLAAALEDPEETDFSRVSSLGSALEALASKIQPQAAAELAKGPAAALENPRETDSDRLSHLSGALAALANKMEPQPAAELVKGLAAALENPQESEHDQLSSLGTALAALANKMEPQPAAELTKSLAAALENPQETNSDRLSSLGTALAALANKMEPQAAAEITRQAAQRLVAVLKNPQETDSELLSRLGGALAAVCRFLPSANRTHLLALSNLLLESISSEAEGEPQPYDPKLLAEVCGQLRTEDLAEVLKYPFCTREAAQIVLKQLEATTGRNFGGNVWKFVEQAHSLGVKDIDSPAKRPSAEDALKELKAL